MWGGISFCWFAFFLMVSDTEHFLHCLLIICVCFFWKNVYSMSSAHLLLGCLLLLHHSSLYTLVINPLSDIWLVKNFPCFHRYLSSGNSVLWHTKCFRFLCSSSLRSFAFVALCFLIILALKYLFPPPRMFFLHLLAGLTSSNCQVSTEMPPARKFSLITFSWDKLPFLMFPGMRLHLNWNIYSIIL